MNVRKKKNLYNYQINWTIFLRASLDQLTYLEGGKSHFCRLIIKMLNIYIWYKIILKNFGGATHTCSSTFVSMCVTVSFCSVNSRMLVLRVCIFISITVMCCGGLNELLMLVLAFMALVQTMSHFVMREVIWLYTCSNKMTPTDNAKNLRGPFVQKRLLENMHKKITR